jgi:uncharacterized protein (DUF1501 family)
MFSRRLFLKSSALAMVGVGATPAWLSRALYAADAPTPRKKVLVAIFQRGAVDGLNVVVPHGEKRYYEMRPTIAIPRPNGSPDTAIDLDGMFGLHPSLSALKPIYDAGQLAVIEAVGSPDPTRSHFDAQDYMESGTPFNKGTASGWLNRAVGLLGHDGMTPFAAVSLTSALPRSLYGDNPSLAIGNLQDFAIQLKGNPALAAAAARSFEDSYGKASPGLMKETGKESFEAMRMLRDADVRNYQPDNGAVYPNSPLGGSMRQIAQLVKMDVGLEVAFTESGGWDTHFNQGTDNGVFARSVTDLSNSMTAFWKDVEAYQDDVTVMTMTEFGRTVHQNGTGGTDHGRASCNFILGNQVAGGRVYGDVKALTMENLEDGRDLPVTTDFRSVFSAVADGHLQIANDRVLFPDWSGVKMGVMKG